MNFIAAFFGSWFVGRKQRQRWEEEMNALIADIERREDIAFNAGFHEGYDAGYDDAFASMRNMDQALQDDGDESDYETEEQDDEDLNDQATAKSAPLTEIPAWQPLFNARIDERRKSIHGTARKRRSKQQNHVPGPWGGTEPRKDSIDG